MLNRGFEDRLLDRRERVMAVARDDRPSAQEREMVFGITSCEEILHFECIGHPTDKTWVEHLLEHNDVGNGSAQHFQQ